tara:strand:- start:1287 stop:2735 length:1449 start_codon:yes stop_codon:yes gene_type:complete
MTGPRFTIAVGDPRSLAWHWVLDQVFGDWLGLSFDVAQGVAGQVSLTAEGKRIVWPDLLISDYKARIDMQGLGQATLDLTDFDGFEEDRLPILLGAGEITRESDAITLGFDPVAMVFFLLSGMEETLVKARDPHDRFSAAQSFIATQGWLERAVADENVEVLRQLMTALWPGLAFATRQGGTVVSCDVDQPFSPDLRKPYPWVRAVGGDLLSRKSVALAARRGLNGVLAPLGWNGLDLSYSFPRYLDVLKRTGLKASFYIISGHSGGAIDGCYTLDEVPIRRLLSTLADAGHELGVHGSYNSYRDPQVMQVERANLLRTCEDLGLDTQGADAHGRGNRQHFLRWDGQVTPDHLDATGFTYDTSGSFADRPGFRYGTARPFTMWSWQTHAALSLRQHPLIAMECSVISDRYMGLKYGEEAYALMRRLQARAIRYGGDFTLLWHNSFFNRSEDWTLFETLLEDSGTSTASALCPKCLYSSLTGG